MKSNAKKKTFINNMITYGMVIAAYLIMQLLISGGHVSSLVKGLLVPFCIYVIMAVSLNLTVGILGELSLGHAGFMCVGAFTGALFSKCMKGAMDPTLSLVIAVLIGAAAAAVFGILIGIPVLRLKGDYLAIVTLAFGEIIKNLVNAIYLGRDSAGFHFSLKDSLSLGLAPDGEVLIKGAQGITGTPQAANFTIGVILVLITLFIVMNIINSRTGRAIMAIRDNRIAAESIGINITKYKLMAFSVSAALAGVAGAQSDDPDRSSKELRLQYVHYDPGICGSWRHRKHQRLCDRYGDPVYAPGAFKRLKQLPYADVCHRSDPRHAL